MYLQVMVFRKHLKGQGTQKVPKTFNVSKRKLKVAESSCIQNKP